jgi:hypothetical protein
MRAAGVSAALSCEANPVRQGTGYRLFCEKLRHLGFEPRWIEPDGAVAHDTSLDCARLAAVPDHNATVGIKNEIMRYARQRKIAV